MVALRVKTVGNAYNVTNPQPPEMVSKWRDQVMESERQEFSHRMFTMVTSCGKQLFVLHIEELLD